MASLRPYYPRPTVRELKRFLFSTPRARPLACGSTSYLLPRTASRCPSSPRRQFSFLPSLKNASPKHIRHDRGPPSQEDTQTDFGALNVLGNTPPPSTGIDACLWDGFHLNNEVKVIGGKGVLLVNGEAFEWCPWLANTSGDETRLVNAKGQWGVSEEGWGLLGVVWPKPDLLILGLGKEMRPVSPETKRFINSLGIRIEIQDTRNAAAQFNLLATERGVGSIAAALIPIGWREGEGVI